MMARWALPVSSLPVNLLSGLGFKIKDQFLLAIRNRYEKVNRLAILFCEDMNGRHINFYLSVQLEKKLRSREKDTDRVQSSTRTAGTTERHLRKYLSSPFMRGETWCSWILLLSCGEIFGVISLGRLFFV